MEGMKKVLPGRSSYSTNRWSLVVVPIIQPTCCQLDSVAAEGRMGGSSALLLVLCGLAELWAGTPSPSSPPALPEADAAFMRRAVELARRAWGRTAPNPCVGCVLVRDDEVVGEGWHARAGVRNRRFHSTQGCR